MIAVVLSNNISVDRDSSIVYTAIAYTKHAMPVQMTAEFKWRHNAVVCTDNGNVV